ncbi:MAG: site-2 protease family protein [Bradyrhizobium sp.]|nr:site-2 protease family protein [Bradyrhizobium sp.]
MSWSLNIGKVAGTVVRLHITFVLFLAWTFVSNYASSGATIAWNSLLFTVLLFLFLCVLLHEFGHIFTARAFGMPTLYVTLNDAIRTRQGAGRVDLAIEQNGC